MAKKALSLVELVISLAVTATIAGMVLAQFSLLDRRTLETTARTLSADLCWARQSAITRHFDYIIELDTANEEYVIFEDRDRDGIAEAFPTVPLNEDEVVKTKPLQVNLESVTDFVGNPQTRITFQFPLGAAQNRIITLRHSGRERPVRVFGETGYPRLDPLIIL